MKILFIVPVYPQDKYPTNVIFVHQQVKALMEAGMDVVVLDIDMRSVRWKRKYGFYKDTFDGVTVYRVSLPIGARVAISQNMLKKCAEYMGLYGYKQIIQDGHMFDLINAQFAFEAGNAAIAIKNKYEIPVVTTEHSSAFMSNSKHLLVMGNVYQNSDVNIAVSDYLAQHIYERFNQKAVVIPNVIDDDKFHVIDTIVKNDVFTFIAVGRLIKWKQFDHLIEAFQIFKKNNIKAKLSIYGVGAEQKNLNNLIASLGMQQYVSLEGAVLNDKLPEVYNNAHVFASASKSETFGVAFIEALACGLPVVSARCGAPESFIDETNGILVTNGNIQELADALLRIYRNYQTYDINFISKSIIEKFGKQSFVEKILRSFENVIETSKNLDC